jgi:outer membrane immunogenic protein
LASESKTLVGATVGGGFEYAFTNNFSAGIEGRYSWYGSQTYNAGLVATVLTPSTVAPPGVFTFAAASQTYKLDTFEVMGKLNWKIF